MVKLCWMKDGVGKKDYYYSFIDSTIYCVRVQEYGQSHGWWSPTLLIYMAGDASEFSYSEEQEFATLEKMIEAYLRGI